MVAITATRPIPIPSGNEPALLCVSGLAAEARIARRAGFRAVVGAGDRRRTAALVAAATEGARCLVSFGIAGALSDALRTGDLIFGAEVVSERGQWRGDETWRRRLADLAITVGATAAPVFGSNVVLATGADKARAHRRFAALAVDLESDIVAAAAGAAGIPFVVLRAIADPAGRDLPPAALIPLAAAGKPDLIRVFASLLRQPGQAVELAQLAREMGRALAALARAAPTLVRLVPPPPMACPAKTA